MEEEDLSERAFLEADLAFHTALARACGNELATLVLKAAGPRFCGRWSRWRRPQETGRRCASACAPSTGGSYEAIEAGDAELASRSSTTSAASTRCTMADAT